MNDQGSGSSLFPLLALDQPSSRASRTRTAQPERERPSSAQIESITPDQLTGIAPTARATLPRGPAAMMLPWQPGSLAFLAVTAGTATYWRSGEPVLARCGSHHILPASGRLRFVIDKPIEILVAVVPAALTMSTVHYRASDLIGPIPRSSALPAILEALLKAALHDEASPSRPSLSAAITRVAVATLEELALRPLSDRTSISTPVESTISGPHTSAMGPDRSGPTQIRNVRGGANP